MEESQVKTSKNNDGEDSGQKKQSICKHFLRNGSCLYGEKCQFLHTLISRNEGNNLNKKRKSSVHSRRSKARNRSKAGDFRRWLLETFGKEVLSSGTGVLDVAGGKSELSFELLNLNRINCTVVDPRPIDISKFILKLEKGYYFRTQPLQKYNDYPSKKSLEQKREGTEEKESNSNYLIPQHLRLFFESKLWTTNSNDGPIYLLEAEKKAQTVVHTNKGFLPNQNLTFQPTLQWQNVQTILKNCSIVVGLHPDQAAEAIVDFGLAQKKPFALIPCCTFSKEFPGRKLPDGTPVTSYEHLIAYLKNKSPEIQMEEMCFEGKNKVLFWKP